MSDNQTTLSSPTTLWRAKIAQLRWQAVQDTVRINELADDLGCPRLSFVDHKDWWLAEYRERASRGCGPEEISDVQ